jgi:hypothetical protein
MLVEEYEKLPKIGGLQDDTIKRVVFTGGQCFIMIKIPLCVWLFTGSYCPVLIHFWNHGSTVYSFH